MVYQPLKYITVTLENVKVIICDAGLEVGRGWFKQWLSDRTLLDSLLSERSIKSSILISRSVIPHLRAFLSAALSLSMLVQDQNPEKLRVRL